MAEEIQEILTKNYSKYITVKCAGKHHGIIDITRQWLDANVPVIIEIDYDSKNGHWIVAVGYAVNERGEMTDLLTLDPGCDSPRSCAWNGILSVTKAPRLRYGYRYTTDTTRSVDIAEAVIITRTGHS